MSNILGKVRAELETNEGKLSFPFIKSLVDAGTVTYFQLSPNMRVCIIKLESGHEVLGKAQVLDAANDIEALGNEVAYNNAVNEVWAVAGNIAKVVTSC